MSTRSDSEHARNEFSAEDRELGMDRDITRRDFINAAAAGMGAALLGSAPPSQAKMSAAPQGTWHPWTGYGGVGDYAISNGNTWDVVNAGHGIRDSLYGSAIAAATPTGETYDLVIAGGGFGGVIAAYTFVKESQRARPCLILDNHPILGGEAKRNEFLVRGQRLIGPQGSNNTRLPDPDRVNDPIKELWRDVGLPTDIEFAQWPANRHPMEVPFNDYSYTFWDFNPTREHKNHGYFFDTPRPHWVTDPWKHRLEGTPWPEPLRRDLLRWRDEPAQPFEGDDASLERWLDSMSYEDYLTKVRKFDPGVARYADPILASAIGPGTDVASALLARHYLPGFEGLSKAADARKRADEARRAQRTVPTFAFPGGNDAIMRALVKWLNPEAIEGSASFADFHNGHIRFEQMDRPGTPCRMRAAATVVSVVHDPQDKRKPATVTYLKDGKFYSVQARTVIYAGSSWTGQHVVQQLPTEYREAMKSYPRSPMLVANVALDNWRAMYKLGYTTLNWRGGLGFCANIRTPMYVGDYRPVLDPDHPAILTFYVPFPQPGLPPAEQGKVARAKLYATSYREFETQIRRQLTQMLGRAGFDPKRDIAGIVLNRWGHAYVNALPGFFYGRDGKPAPSEVLRQPLGNLAFSHSEIGGAQGWIEALLEGTRAARQVLEML